MPRARGPEAVEDAREVRGDADDELAKEGVGPGEPGPRERASDAADGATDRRPRQHAARPAARSAGARSPQPPSRLLASQPR